MVCCWRGYLMYRCHYFLMIPNTTNPITNNTTNTSTNNTNNTNNANNTQ